MKSFRLLILISGLLVIFTEIRAQNLEFYREDILFKLNVKGATTDAHYYFCNVGKNDLRTVLFYPFPDSTFNLIDTLRVETMPGHVKLPFRKALKGIYFEIFIKAYGQSEYRVFFNQKLKERHFKYILTSTSSWGRPLENVSYELQMPQDIKVDSLTYPPDTTYSYQAIHFYKWKKLDFMPDKDFEVFFK